MIRIAHLIDDTNPGGVTRYLEFLRTDPGMARIARHDVVPVPRNFPAKVAVDADMIVSHLGISWRSLPGLMLLRARHARLPLLHVEHSYSQGFAAGNVVSQGRFRTLLRTAYALFDHVVAVSRAQGAWLTRRGLVSAHALSVIPPCVTLDPYRAMVRPRGPVRIIGAVGRFDRQKGFDVLIRAFRQLPGADLRLFMVGDGPENAHLRSLAKGDPRIVFTGFVRDTAAMIAMCDAVAMPSRWEPYGLVAQEARAAGRPVLVSRVDGLGTDHASLGAHVVAELTDAGWKAALARLVAGQMPAVPVSIVRDEALTRKGWTDLLDAVGKEMPKVAAVRALA